MCCGLTRNQTRKAIHQAIHVLASIASIASIHDRPRIRTEHARRASSSSTTREQTALARVEPRRPQESHRRPLLLRDEHLLSRCEHSTGTRECRCARASAPAYPVLYHLLTPMETGARRLYERLHRRHRLRKERNRFVGHEWRSHHLRTGAHR